MKLNTDSILNNKLNKGLKIYFLTFILIFILLFELYLFPEFFLSEYYNFSYVLYKYTVNLFLLIFILIIFSSKKLNLKWTFRLFLIISNIIIVPIIFRISCDILVLWIYLAINILIFYLTSSNNITKTVYVNIFIFVVLITILESILQINLPDKDRREIVHKSLKNVKFKRFNDTLGYSPSELNEVNAICKIDDDTLYNVVYSIDSFGRRNIPSNYKGLLSDTNIIFEGCSFTFGTGLNDNQTCSYYLKDFNNKLKVFNLGFDGYSPFQILSFSILPNLKGFNINDSSYTIVIINLINDHLFRIIGFERNIYYKEAFYEFDSIGNISFKGDFLQKKNIFDILSHYFRKSLIFKPFVDKYYYTKASSDINLYRLINSIKNIKKNFRNIFRNMRMILIYWDDYDELSLKIFNLLKNNNFECYKISDIMPSYKTNKDLYQIQIDGHPNAYANKILAKYLLDLITEEKSKDSVNNR